MPRLSPRARSVWFCVVSRLAASLSAASLPVAPVLVAPLLAPVVASILVSFGLLSCASQQVVDGFARIEPGMTKDEVIEKFLEVREIMRDRFLEHRKAEGARGVEEARPKDKPEA